MESNYYFWKWADNDLPGRPAEIMAALQRGDMHPAIQPFDPRRLLSTLRRTASRRPKDERWGWEVVAAASAPGLARYVYVTRTPAKDLDEWEGSWRFWLAFEPLGVSGGVQQSGLLIPGNPSEMGRLPPKRNCFSTSQSTAHHYDVEPADLPALVRSVDPDRYPCFAVLEDWRGNFVQFSGAEPEYVVEWSCKAVSGKETTWDHLRARDPNRPVAEEEAERERVVATTRSTATYQYYPLSADRLRFDEVVDIFAAFIRGEPRPARWLWCDIPEEPETNARGPRSSSGCGR